ncbi:MAG: hypothetical protein HY586_04180 [Candidatus Omnitrophica bacterium]|nr:hypothetical protein [Candidatus Omnitrophota bacterium]
MLNSPARALLFLPVFFLSSQALLHSSSSFDLRFFGCAQLLRTHVKEGRVDYASLKQSPKLLNAYLPQGAAKEISESTRIQWLGYDWSLNESY